jgi:2,3-bisphosphoglycerate-independent phosphoglycerate mutase
MVAGEGDKAASAAACMEASYANGVNDEFVVPTVIEENGAPVGKISANDSIIFYNFRPDRARQMTRAFCDEDFTGFERVNGFMPVKFVCFTDYDETITNKTVAYRDEVPANTLGEYISKQGLKQLRIAETEKYAHVTFFFNGGVEEPNAGEERILVPSPKEVPTYDLKPEMSALGVTEKLVDAISNKKADLIIINYANPDMVGHTGVIDAAVKAIETIDSCVAEVVDALVKVDGQMFICADHGNSDQLVDYATGKPFTAHTTNPVPFVLVNCHKATGLMEDGKLCDIAPTLLDMMDLPQPEEMTGHSLLIK